MNFIYTEKLATADLIGSIIFFDGKPHPEETQILTKALKVDIEFLLQAGLIAVNSKEVIKNMNEENKQVFCEIIVEIIKASGQKTTIPSHVINKVLEETDLIKNLINYSPTLYALLITSKYINSLINN